ncbi:MAG: hypothetical protein Roseis2KO_05570 [Roseivirga sp.]
MRTLEKAKIIFLGDVSFSGQNANSLHFVDNELRNTFNSADAVICNFESTFTTEENPDLFQSPSSKAVLLKEAGITHAIVANNHIYDYGYEGLENTISVLKSAGIEPLGLKKLRGIDQQVIALTIKGIKLGLLCSGWTRVRQDPKSPDVYWEYDEAGITAAIREFNPRFDHLLVVCHRGKMFVEYPTPSDKTAFRSYLNLGASAVIAHHPHVAQGVSFTGNKLIAYSLGNFFFDSTEGHVQSKYSKEKQDLGLAVEVCLTKEMLQEYQLIPIKRTDDLGVVKLASAESSKVLKAIDRVSSNTSKALVHRILFYWQYLRYVVPHFLLVFWKHNIKS